jgi:hypothetical protein
MYYNTCGGKFNDSRGKLMVYGEKSGPKKEKRKKKLFKCGDPGRFEGLPILSRLLAFPPQQKQ